MSFNEAGPAAKYDASILMPGEPRNRPLRTALRRRWQLVAACCVLASAVAVVLSVREPNRYTAKAQLLFRDPHFDQQLFGGSGFLAAPDPARQAATNLRLVTSRTVAERTAAAIGHGLTASDVANEVDASPQGESDVMSLEVTDRSPRRAALIANTYARQYILFRQSADRAVVEAAQRQIQQQVDGLTPSARRGVEGRSLQSRAEELRIFAQLQTGNAELVQQAAIPGSPSSPRPRRNGLLGLLVGALLGVILALLFERMDHSFRDLNEVEETIALPVLGTIPVIRSAPEGATKLAAEMEPFRMLRARLRYFNIDRHLRTVLVTSASPGEGKSTVSSNLAAAAATADVRVLLLECDMRQPRLAEVLEVSPSPGLSELLTHEEMGLRDVLQHVEPATPMDQGRAAFDVLVGGAVPPNPLELVESSRMEALLTELETLYDFIVVDTPPTSIVSDALPLLRRVDGVVVVVRIGQSSRHSTRRLMTQLSELGAPHLGVIVNGVDQGRGYGYGYGYGSPGTHNQEREARTSTAAASTDGDAERREPG